MNASTVKANPSCFRPLHRNATAPSARTQSLAPLLQPTALVGDLLHMPSSAARHHDSRQGDFLPVPGSTTLLALESACEISNQIMTLLDLADSDDTESAGGGGEGGAPPKQ
jgi:hypothetical protein